jgi:hypothetical protein
MPQANIVITTPPVNGAETRPGLARRSFLAGVAAMLPAAATASAATPAPANPDAELIALAAEIADLQIQMEAADAEYDRCDEIYRAKAPQRSRKLFWKFGDPVGYLREIHYEDGRTYLLCDLDEVERLRGRTSFPEWIFTGTPEEAKKLCIPNWRDNRSLPVVGYGHLFTSVHDERREKRAKELIAALDEYCAADEAAKIATGYLAATEACEAIYESMEKLRGRMLELAPTTLEGYQALESARAA